MRSIALLVPFAQVLLPAAAAPAPETALLIPAAADGLVDAVINNVPLRLRISFDHVEGVTLNPEAAARAGLEERGRWTERIGPIVMRGYSVAMPLSLAGAATRASVRWRAAPAAAGADGAVSVHSLPFDSVTIERAAAGAVARELTFPIRVHANHGVHYRLPVGRRRVAVRFSFDRPRTTAPAAAAAILAERQGGTLSETRSEEEIAPTIVRPVRRLAFGRPLWIGGLAVPALMVRTADFRGGHALQWAEAASDGEEIVVTAAAPSQEALYRITLGLDVLGRCSSATYRRRARTLSLRCAGD